MPCFTLRCFLNPVRVIKVLLQPGRVQMNLKSDFELETFLAKFIEPLLEEFTEFTEPLLEEFAEML